MHGVTVELRAGCSSVACALFLSDIIGRSGSMSGQRAEAGIKQLESISAAHERDENRPGVLHMRQVLYNPIQHVKLRMFE